MMLYVYQRSILDGTPFVFAFAFPVSGLKPRGYYDCNRLDRFARQLTAFSGIFEFKVLTQFVDFCEHCDELSVKKEEPELPF